MLKAYNFQSSHFAVSTEWIFQQELELDRKEVFIGLFENYFSREDKVLGRLKLEN